MAVAAGAAALWVDRTRGHGLPHDWRGRVVLITGGSRGLGLALARRLGADGAVVCLLARDADELERAVELLRAEGIRAESSPADVTDRFAYARAIRAVTTAHGRLDALVNNAGVITAMPFDDALDDDFDESLRVHFWGPLYGIRAALPWLRRASPGHLVNISSIGGRVGIPHLAPYCAGKFALTGLSEAIGPELAADGVRVTTVTPGLMRTGSIRHARVRGQHAAEARWFAALGSLRLTSMSAERASAQIVAGMSAGRAAVRPGWQSRLLQVASAAAPGLVAAMFAVVVARVLPAPAGRFTPARPIGTIDLGRVGRLASTEVETRYNQRPT